jgi:hypothetical protein
VSRCDFLSVHIIAVANVGESFSDWGVKFAGNATSDFRLGKSLHLSEVRLPLDGSQLPTFSTTFLLLALLVMLL